MRIGIDLGGSKIEGIVLADDGAVLNKMRVPTPAGQYSETIETVCQMVESLQNKFNRLMPVGIGTPGALSDNGLMKNCNSVVLNGKALQSDIENRLGYAIRLENDANCFALSEAHYGAAKDAHIVFGVIIGTGTGGGIVINNQLLTGPNNIAGEWGHNALPCSARELIKTNRKCYCGRENCIETVLSGQGLTQTFLERYAADFSAEKIAVLAQEGDTHARDCIDVYCQQLACCLATVVNIIDPDIIVLGGGLSNIPALYDEVLDYMRHYVFTDNLRTRLSRPAFGDASGARGAACLWPQTRN